MMRYPPPVAAAAAVDIEGKEKEGRGVISEGLKRLFGP